MMRNVGRQEDDSDLEEGIYANVEGTSATTDGRLVIKCIKSGYVSATRQAVIKQAEEAAEVRASSTGEQISLVPGMANESVLLETANATSEDSAVDQRAFSDSARDEIAKLVSESESKKRYEELVAKDSAEGMGSSFSGDIDNVGQVRSARRAMVKQAKEAAKVHVSSTGEQISLVPGMANESVMLEKASSPSAGDSVDQRAFSDSARDEVAELVAKSRSKKKYQALVARDSAPGKRSSFSGDIDNVGQVSAGRRAMIRKAEAAAKVRVSSTGEQINIADDVDNVGQVSSARNAMVRKAKEAAKARASSTGEQISLVPGVDNKSVLMETANAPSEDNSVDQRAFSDSARDEVAELVAKSRSKKKYQALVARDSAPGKRSSFSGKLDNVGQVSAGRAVLEEKFRQDDATATTTFNGEAAAVGCDSFADERGEIARMVAEGGNRARFTELFCGSQESSGTSRGM